MNKQSSLLRILLHGFFLISTNLFSVMIAFVIVRVALLNEEKIVQSSLALVINIGIYWLVYKVMSRIQDDFMRIDNFSMFAIILLVSLALLPAIFYPMHYLTQGYWSSFDNLLVTWPFQLIVNGLCLVMNYFLLRSEKK